MADEVLGCLAGLAPGEISELYKDVCTCVAVLRCLPSLGRQMVMRLAFLEQPVEVSAWVAKSTEAVEEMARALDAMRSVRILEDGGGGGGLVRLAPVYRQQLLKGLKERDTSPWKDGRDGSGSPATSAEALRKYASNRWESVLHCMVAPAHESSARPERGWKPTKEVNQLLMRETPRGALMKDGMDEDGYSGAKITAQGFQFLLRPLRAQVWQLLVDAIEVKSKELGTTKSHLLICLFQLSFCIVGVGYSFDNLSHAQQKFVHMLGHIGAVFVDGPSSRTFWPTQLVVNLCWEDKGVQDTSLPDRTSGEGKCIIVETNYRLYAYTNSALQEQVLRLFSQLQYRLPHMLICIITRASVRNALIKGITASQIIQYLTLHAHPQSSLKTPAVPEVVTDQIIFWERERVRISAEPAIVYHDFSRVENFKLVEKEAGRLGVLQYAADNEGVVVVPESAGPEMKAFIERGIEA